MILTEPLKITNVARCRKSSFLDDSHFAIAAAAIVVMTMLSRNLYAEYSAI